jgi:hypothetical protein
MSGMSAGNVVTIDNWYLREIGCVSDYDLAFANPTQSRTVQDRSGAADGTCSASGVTQVQPVVQLNSTSARIGTFAATPADGQILADGKAKTAPSYSFGHTTATGMYSPGANQIRFSTASTDRLTIASDGAVSLGPGTAAVTTLKPSLLVTDTDVGGSITIRGQSPILAFDKEGSGTGTILTDGGGLNVKDGTLDGHGNTHLAIDSSGNVGVGCDPSYPLEVQSGGVGTVLRAGADFVSIDSTGTEAEPTLILNGDANTGLWHPAADTLAVSTGGAERLRISSTGDITCTGDITSTNATGSKPILTLENTTNDANSSQLLFLKNRTATNNDNLGTVRFRGKNNAGTPEVVEYATIYAQSTNVAESEEDGKLIFRTMKDGNLAPRLTIASNGVAEFSNGIAFPAPTPASAGTPAASSVLDVYEIGTWTPVLNGVTGGNSTGVYTRIGNMCYFAFYSGSITSTAVDATFSGLPFECSAYYGTITASHNTWVPNADSGYVAVSTHTGKFTPSASISTATATAGTGRYIMFSGYYRVK